MEALTAIISLPLAYSTAVNALSTATAGVVTVTVTSTSLSTAPASSGDQATDTKSTSAMVTGLGAGLGVGIPLLLALTTALFFLHRTRKQLSNMQNQQILQKQQIPYHVPTHEVKSNPSPYEMPIHEVHNNALPYEMSSASTGTPKKVDTNVPQFMH